MPPIKIVDASALGALVFGEPEAEKVSEAMSNSALVAPLLLWFELSSICLKKIKKHPDQKDNLLNAYHLAQVLPIEMAAVDYLDAMRLAEEKQVTTYDASYLWVSQQLRGELVTLERKSLAAAKR
jgi:predicted nucleic acid-binding protein